MRIEGKVPELQIKQKVYMPGVTCYATCSCGKEVSVNMAKVYLSFFQVNCKSKLYFECSCGKGWSEDMIISLSIQTLAL